MVIKFHWYELPTCRCTTGHFLIALRLQHWHTPSPHIDVISVQLYNCAHTKHSHIDGTQAGTFTLLISAFFCRWPSYSWGCWWRTAKRRRCHGRRCSTWQVTSRTVEGSLTTGTAAASTPSSASSTHLKHLHLTMSTPTTRCVSSQLLPIIPGLLHCPSSPQLAPIFSHRNAIPPQSLHTSFPQHLIFSNFSLKFYTVSPAELPSLNHIALSLQDNHKLLYYW